MNGSQEMSKIKIIVNIGISHDEQTKWQLRTQFNETFFKLLGTNYKVHNTGHIHTLLPSS